MDTAPTAELLGRELPRHSGPVSSPPPWLWLWYGYLVAMLPSVAAGIRSYLDQFVGRDLPDGLTGTPSWRPIQLMAAAHLVPTLIFYLGTAAVLLPGLRGRYAEWRWALRPAGEVTRPHETALLLRQVTAFLAAAAPDVELRVNTRRRGSYARIYPSGWRGARIAVFPDFFKLWRTDQAAARAALLHEVAHHRNGDRLIVGLGSPFTLLIKAWAAAYACLALAPMLVFAAAPHLTTVPLLGEVVLLLAEPAQILLLPVTALWLAELAADQYAAELGGRAALDTLLTPARRRPRRSAWLRLEFLSHPPRELRRRIVMRPNASRSLLLTAFPLAVIVQYAATLPPAIGAWRLLGYGWGDTWRQLESATRTYLASAAPLWALLAVALAAWPRLARRWTALWARPPSRQAEAAPEPTVYRRAFIVPAALTLTAALAGLIHPKAQGPASNPAMAIDYPLVLRANAAHCQTDPPSLASPTPSAAQAETWLRESTWTFTTDRSVALSTPDAQHSLPPLHGTFVQDYGPTEPTGLAVDILTFGTSSTFDMLQLTGHISLTSSPPTGSISWRGMGRYSGNEAEPGSPELDLRCSLTLTGG